MNIFWRKFRIESQFEQIRVIPNPESSWISLDVNRFKINLIDSELSFKLELIRINPNTGWTKPNFWPKSFQPRIISDWKFGPDQPKLAIILI